MALNKSKGNMYPFVTHTWNPIKGHCPHACVYCYYQANPRYKDKIGELRIDYKCLQDDLGEDRTIFIGSSIDMWHFDIAYSWLECVLDKCRRYTRNTYLFQSKNPARFNYMGLPFSNSIVGTTIETNRSMEEFSKTPEPIERASMLYHLNTKGRGRMISMEPIMDFDLKEIITWFSAWIRPEFVSIGADSKGHNLPEPPPEKIKELISELEKFTEVKIKKNLSRLQQKPRPDYQTGVKS